MQQWPDSFLQQSKALFKDDFESFINALDNPALTHVRFNKFKRVEPTFNIGKKIEWCRDAYTLQERPSFIADPVFHAGAYYVQESSSMFLEHVLLHLLSTNSVNSVLDLCASPGGKTTIIQNTVPETTMVVANEIIKSRFAPLVQNVLKWGTYNTFVTNNNPEHFEQLSGFFDIVLVDAPCSGEGLFRRNNSAINEWSADHVKLCSLRQQKILHSAVQALKTGGYLIYSTCTFNELENEKNIQWLIEKYKLNLVKIPIETDWPIAQFKENCYRFLPHKTDGEGLFMAVLQKTSYEINKVNYKNQKVKLNETQQFNSWLKEPEKFLVQTNKNKVYALPKSFINEYLYFNSKLNLVYQPLFMGETDKNNQLIPSHALALSLAISDLVNSIELDYQQAIKYLRNESLLINNHPMGFNLVTFKKLSLGFIKVLQNRTNNYLPTEWRIIKQIQ